MARKPEMINRVIEMLADGKSTDEIIEETKCSKSTVSIARKRLAAQNNHEDEEAEYTDDEINESISSFIKSIKITPPPKEPESEEVEETEYQCYECDHTWMAPPNEVQKKCPECGLEFA